VLAAGSNDLVDMQPCSRDAAMILGRCASDPSSTFRGFNLGVGIGGVYFSFDRGQTWVQPTYQGLTAANCDPTLEPCTPVVGPIHTVPNFYEAGLRTRGDPGVAFGPVPVNGQFSWSNGSRLYYSMDVTNLTDTRIEQGGIKSVFGIAVSHIDNVTPERIQDQHNWSQPVLVAEHDAVSAFLDKPLIWADNAASSPFFGRVYDCYSDYRLESRGPSIVIKPMVAVSTDGGVSWKTRQIAAPYANLELGGRVACVVRTDSKGVVYAFLSHYANGLPGVGTMTMVKSFNGGATWTPPTELLSVNDACWFFDLVSFNCVLDGVAGARTSGTTFPSIDIANGAPSGADATNQLVLAWTDGSLGLDQPRAVLSYSMDGGTTWSAPTSVSVAGDRPMFTGAALSPEGKQLYVVYQAFQTPFQDTTANPRLEHGVLRRASIGPDGAPTGWTTVYSGPSGDARGTSQGRYLYNEFLGDYASAIATRTYGAGVWTDTRDTVDCPAMDGWRQASFNAGQTLFPAPWPLGDCPVAFGNNNIFLAGGEH
jgi:hypothetical protein